MQWSSRAGLEATSMTHWKRRRISSKSAVSSVTFSVQGIVHIRMASYLVLYLRDSLVGTLAPSRNFYS